MIKVTLKDLICFKDPENGNSFPLSSLSEYDRIYGGIYVCIDDNTNFKFGWSFSHSYIGEWYYVLQRMHRKILKGENFSYEYPFPGQGEPILEFVFDTIEVLVRTTYYLDDSWTVVDERSEIEEERFERKIFELIVSECIKKIEETVLVASQTEGKKWIARNTD